MPEKRKIKKTSHHITTRQTKITTILVQRFLSSIVKDTCFHSSNSSCYIQDIHTVHVHV